MTSKPVKPDIRFIIRLEEDNTYGDRLLKANVSVVVMTDEGLRNPSFGWSDDTGAGQYADLEIRALFSKGSNDFYGRDPEFHPYSVDVRRAESMAKTLKRVYASLKRQDERLGTPTDFAAFLARLAIALGCREKSCFGRRASARQGFTYADNDYRWMDADALRIHLNCQTGDWQKKYFPQEVSS
jgi:hypothetical protein